MRVLGVLILAAGIILASCSKEEWTVTDNFVTDTYKEMRDGQLGGHHRCYKANFPLTIVFPDESTAEVGDREEFVTTLKAWKEANPDSDTKPTIQLPFSITKADGEVIEVTSQEQIRELRKECREHKNGHRKCRHFARFLDNKCFEVTLPITMVMADGELITIDRKIDVIKVLREWKQDRPEDVPEISFPISVTIKETGELQEIADQEAFDALVEICKE